MPKNLEGYYQEIGRSGRDGSDADALLFYSWGDFVQLKQFIDGSQADDEFKKVQEAKLRRMWEYCQSSDCRVNFILNYFGEYRNKGCGYCDHCLQPPTKIVGNQWVQMATSAVIRSKESLPMSLLIDVLRGSSKREVFEGGWNRIKTYGVGKDTSGISWKEYITQMIDKGILTLDYTDHMKIKLTPLSMSAVHQTEPIYLKKASEPSNAADIQTPAKMKSTKKQKEEELMQILRSWRKTKSKEENVPAYIIMTDRTLGLLSSEMPVFKSDLMSIEGMGQQRMEKYGNELLQLIRKFIFTDYPSKSVKGRTSLITMDLLHRGLNPEEIAAERGISLDAVYNHLIQLYNNGETIHHKRYITVEEIERVRTAYRNAGAPDTLSEIAAFLRDPLPFYKIKLALALMKE